MSNNNNEKNGLELAGGIVLIVGASKGLGNTGSYIIKNDLENNLNIFDSYQDFFKIFNIMEVGHMITLAICITLLVIGIKITSNEKRNELKIIIVGFVLAILSLNPIALVGGILTVASLALYNDKKIEKDE